MRRLVTAKGEGAKVTTKAQMVPDLGIMQEKFSKAQQDIGDKFPHAREVPELQAIVNPETVEHEAPDQIMSTNQPEVVQPNPQLLSEQIPSFVPNPLLTPEQQRQLLQQQTTLQNPLFQQPQGPSFSQPTQRNKQQKLSSGPTFQTHAAMSVDKDGREILILPIGQTLEDFISEWQLEQAAQRVPADPDDEE